MRLKNNIAVSESGFLFDPNSGESFNLNKSGQLIVRLLSESLTREEIVEKIKANYEIENITIQRYLDDFTQMLGQYNLIEIEEA